MRAAAQFERIDRPAGAMGIAAHRHDAHFIAIFLAEQRHGAFGDRLIDAHQARGDRVILLDDFIGDCLDLRAISSALIGLLCEKSKRKRSGSTSEPFCATWLPSDLAQAPRAGDASPNDAAGCPSGAHDRRSSSTASPGLSAPFSRAPKWTMRSPTRFCVSVTRNTAPSAL